MTLKRYKPEQVPVRKGTNQKRYKTPRFTSPTHRKSTNPTLFSSSSLSSFFFFFFYSFFLLRHDHRRREAGRPRGLHPPATAAASALEAAHLPSSVCGPLRSTWPDCRSSLLRPCNHENVPQTLQQQYASQLTHTGLHCEQPLHRRGGSV